MTYKQAVTYYDRFTFIELRNVDFGKLMDIHSVSNDVTFNMLMIKCRQADKSWARGLK